MFEWDIAFSAMPAPLFVRYCLRIGPQLDGVLVMCLSTSLKALQAPNRPQPSEPKIPIGP